MITKKEYIKKWKDFYAFIIEVLCEPFFEIIVIMMIIFLIIIWVGGGFTQC